MTSVDAMQHLSADDLDAIAREFD
ncbi:MAG: hypothetical protein QOE11_1817, partial [Solirubrobacteraceae bacterium]|nr:hypothetical protein [Solirubrobacteraceae bacterium]